MSMLRLKEISLNFPWLGGVTLQPNDAEAEAAWRLYVQLKTRVATQELCVNEGLLREALDSYHRLFDIIRGVLMDAGPSVGAKHSTVGGVAFRVLNEGIRPVLGYWHPRLELWEAKRPEGAGRFEHERRWEHAQEMRERLEALRVDLTRVAEAFAQVSGALPSPEPPRRETRE